MQSVVQSPSAPGLQSAPHQAPAEIEGRYRYVGGGWDNFVLKVGNVLLSLVTCGLAAGLGYTTWRNSKYKVEHITVDGEPLRYTASWGDEWANHFIHSLLLMVTCGLAAPWVIARNNKFRYSHATTADGRPLDFQGDGVGVIGLTLLTVFGLFLSFGLAWPWIAVAWRSWLASNIVVVDPRAPNGSYHLRFDAGGLAFLVQGILNGLLVQVTFGLYLPFAITNFERWAWASTSDEVSPPVRVPVGPQTPAQWAVVVGAGAGFLAMVALILFAGISAAGGGALLSGRMRGDERNTATATMNAREIRNATMHWRSSHGNRCPTIEMLVRDGEIDRASKVDDPWNRPFTIRCVGGDVTVMSAGPDRREGTGDDIVVGRQSATARPCPPGDPMCDDGPGSRPEPQEVSPTPAPAPAAAAVSDRPEGFPEEVPRTRTKPPTVKEWSESPTVKMQPEGCFRKVVREWMKLNCSKSEANHPHPGGFSGLSNYGTEYADYFVWVRAPDVADVVVRMSPGRRGVATMQLEAQNLEVGYDWTDSGPYPKVVWE